MRFGAIICRNYFFLREPDKGMAATSWFPSGTIRFRPPAGCHVGECSPAKPSRYSGIYLISRIKKNQYPLLTF
jgi:hypothetical protein